MLTSVHLQLRFSVWFLFFPSLLFSAILLALRGAYSVHITLCMIIPLMLRR